MVLAAVAGALPPPPARPDARAAAPGAAPGAPARSLLPPSGPALRPSGDEKEWLVLGIESSCDDTGAAVKFYKQ